MSDFLERMMQKIYKYSAASIRLYDRLTTESEIETIFYLQPTPPEYGRHTCFRMYLKPVDMEIDQEKMKENRMEIEIGKETKENIFGISVAYATSENVIEIALINESGNRIYVGDVGYYDVQIFYSYEEFLEELKRIHSEIIG